jgi:TolB protein
MRADPASQSAHRGVLAALGAVLLVAFASEARAAAVAEPAATPRPSAPTLARSFPAVSPDGRWIVYLEDAAGTTDLYVVPAAGGEPRRLTATAEAEGNPSWTRDGRLTFSVGDGAESRLVAVAADGSGRRELARVPGRGPRLSPDGRHVLYARGSWTEVELFAAERDGSAAHRLNDGKTVAWNAEWSPDGTRIAFTSRDGDGNLQISVVPADGSQPPRQLTHLAKAEGNAQGPSWSPDASEIAFFAGGPAPHTSHLWIVDVASGQARRVGAAHDAYLDEVPRWFPDGKRLVYQSDRSGRMEIWVGDRDGGASKQVTQ